MQKIGNNWDELLKNEFRQEYYLRLREFLKHEYASGTVYPNMYNIFNALKITDYDAVKAVILGQDPYHGEGQAHGLSFSVQNGVALPPSLQNIYKELQTDLGIPPAKTGDLTPWAKQGVLLLNTVLTVRGGIANSHKGKGWEEFTDRIITLLNERKKSADFQSLAFGFRGGASQSAFRLQRLFRLPSFIKHQRLFGAHRSGAHQLEPLILNTITPAIIKKSPKNFVQ